MSAVLRALVAVCPHRPFNLGHVGWGYQQPDGQWSIGAVEGEGRGELPNGYWTARAATLEEVIAIFRAMKARDAEYDTLKLLTPAADAVISPHAADRVSAWVREQPYQLIDRNCMDSTYDILRAFAPRYTLGALPTPDDNWLPNDWYAKLPGLEEVPLAAPAHAAATQPPRAPQADALAPAWRVPGHPLYLPPRKPQAAVQVSLNRPGAPGL